MKDGVIADFTVTEQMLNSLSAGFTKPVFSVPAHAS